MKKLYLDDVRCPKTEGWDIVRTYEDFVDWVTKNGIPNEVSFDHDLAEIDYDPTTQTESFKYHEKTGYDAAKFLVDVFYDNNVDRFQMNRKDKKESEIKFPVVYVHSANPIGSANIMGYINNFYMNEGQPQTCVRVQIPHTTDF